VFFGAFQVLFVGFVGLRVVFDAGVCFRGWGDPRSDRWTAFCVWDGVGEGPLGLKADRRGIGMGRGMRLDKTELTFLDLCVPRRISSVSLSALLLLLSLNNSVETGKQNNSPNAGAKNVKRNQTKKDPVPYRI